MVIDNTVWSVLILVSPLCHSASPLEETFRNNHGTSHAETKSVGLMVCMKEQKEKQKKLMTTVLL